MSDVRDRWAAGSSYEEFMGRWSRQLARPFLSWLSIPAGVHWLDVGCGTGALTGAICAHADPASVLGCDPAEAFVEYARQHASDGRASFVVSGSGNLPRRQGGYGSISSLLALNFFPDAEAAIGEMCALAARNAVISACVWDYSGRMEFLRYFWNAAAEIDPAARTLDEGERFPVCRRPALVDLFRAAGLGHVHCQPIDIPTRFRAFDDYWRPLLGGTGPAPSYVASLDPERRARLARTLDESLPRTREGTIALTARGWAVRGVAP